MAGVLQRDAAPGGRLLLHTVCAELAAIVMAGQANVYLLSKERKQGRLPRQVQPLAVPAGRGREGSGDAQETMIGTGGQSMVQFGVGEAIELMLRNAHGSLARTGLRRGRAMRLSPFPCSTNALVEDVSLTNQFSASGRLRSLSRLSVPQDIVKPCIRAAAFLRGNKQWFQEFRLLRKDTAETIATAIHAACDALHQAAGALDAHQRRLRADVRVAFGLVQVHVVMLIRRLMTWHM